jgi:hypothetical protein
MNRPIAMQMIRNALMAVGTQEEGENSGDEVEFYLSQCKPQIGVGSPWCAAFVRAMMKTAATQLSLTYDSAFPRSGYTPDWANYAKKNSLWVPVSAIKDGTAVPRKGDLALFYFSQLGRIGHIGIVIDVHPTYMWTIEGNTSPEPEVDGIVDRDGDGVYKKNRQWNELGKFGGILRVNF